MVLSIQSENSMIFFKKLQLDLPDDPAIPLLGISKKNGTQGFKQVFVEQCAQEHCLQ
jgi:hypothetical protein